MAHITHAGKKYPVPLRAPREMYLSDDIAERHNAIEEHPQLAAELTSLLRERRPLLPAVSPEPTSPPLDERTRRQLEELGYIE